jgi:hypothetical protein
MAEVLLLIRPTVSDERIEPPAAPDKEIIRLQTRSNPMISPASI